MEISKKTNDALPTTPSTAPMITLTFKTFLEAPPNAALEKAEYRHNHAVFRHRVHLSVLQDVVRNKVGAR